MKRLTTNQLRKLYLDFFVARRHRLVKSDSLVPTNDPSLLFTSAGMNQFKDHFLGRIKDFRRATSCQKCLRTGDLDQVGQTPHHHTFFEMLGNFSFGDYFKKEAIDWGWEFVTQALEIDKQDLWVSVYEDDVEAYDLWLRHIGVLPQKIKKLGAKDNFWPSNAILDGPNGPCGPCSEIYYKRSDGSSVEVWNLVFTQYDRRDRGVLEPLPSKNIDTGMGLERMSSVLQGVDSNFNIDIFAPIVAAAKRTSGLADAGCIHAIADHCRAVAFCICDGVLPSNEGRGYVVRKLIRRCLAMPPRDHLKPYLYQVVSSVAGAMGEAYPELLERRDNIAQIIKAEEEKYIRNILEGGSEKLAGVIEGLRREGKTELPARVGFDLYVTYGIQPEFTEEECGRGGVRVDREAIRRLIEGEQTRSRASSKMSASIFSVDEAALEPSEFVGYETDACIARVLQILKESKKVDEARIGEDVGIVLDKTPFYGASGGQVGDRGELILKGTHFKVAIEDTKKEGASLVHFGRVAGPDHAGRECLRVGDAVEAVVDVRHRQGVRRAHTATHILHAALKKVLGEHVQQAGSLVEPDRLRFDFTHFKDMTQKETDDVQDLLQDLVLRDDPVVAEAMSRAEARKTGAVALFGEKYGETVRVISVGDYSKEFCGGTHLDATGEVGPIFILSESSVGSSLRRIEAVTGRLAYEKIKKTFDALQDVAGRLKAKTDQVLAVLDEHLSRQKMAERELLQLRETCLKQEIERRVKTPKDVAGFKVVAYAADEPMDPQLARWAIDFQKKAIPVAGVFVVVTQQPSGVNFVCGTTANTAGQIISAKDLVCEIVGLAGGSGGGRTDFAQGGTKDMEKAQRLLKDPESTIEQCIKKIAKVS